MKTDKYMIAGQANVFLCKRCVRQRIKRKFLWWFVLFLIAVIGTFFINRYPHNPDDALRVLWAFAVAITPISLLLLLTNLKWTGNDLSIIVKKSKYQTMGYGSFFNPRQYKKLRPEH
jgi:magnesium-transporting ATPase (P-type)